MTAKGELHDQQNSFFLFQPTAVLLAYQQPENHRKPPSLRLNRSSAAHIFSQMHIHLSSSSIIAMIVIHAQLPAQQTFL